MSTSFSNAPALFGRGTLRVCRRGQHHQKSILLVALNRPAVRNAINDDMYEDLIAILQCATHEDSISALVLTGTGSFFSSGADLKDSRMAFVPEPSGRQTLQKPAGRFMMEWIAFPKILAAAVNGPAVGIGCTLLLHCDLVHCSTGATFWAPFTRLALVPELCSSVTFLETMGLSKSNEMLLLGKQIDAPTALQWNICSEVVAIPGDDSTTSTTASFDPFDPRSLASRMCQELDKNLLSLPLGDRTASHFVSMIRGRRRARLEQVCRQELVKLDERFDSGQVQEAAQHISIGSKTKSARKESNTISSRL